MLLHVTNHAKSMPLCALLCVYTSGLDSVQRAVTVGIPHPHTRHPTSHIQIPL
jgi:hypothetical protein